MRGQVTVSRRAAKLGLIAKWVLGLVLLAHIAVAAPACLMPANPASVIAGADAMESCDPRVSRVPAQCLAQCLQSDQLSDPPGDHTPFAASAGRFTRVSLPLSAEIIRAENAPAVGPPVFLRSHRLRL